MEAESINPALESLRWKKYPVLDDGLVALVDCMGTDQSVVQAARVSYGSGTKKVSDDRNLIRYLMRHRHTTPFEMVELKFFIRVPMDTWRQMVRHRTFCLAEGTELYFDLPSGLKNNKSKLYKMKIEDIFRKYQPTKNKIKTQQKNPFYKKELLETMNLRQVNEENHKIQHTNITDVCFSGVKPVFRMILSDGKSIECSVDHSFLFSDGWGSLKDKTGLTLSKNNIPAWDKEDKFIYVNGMDVVSGSTLYQDKNWLKNQYETLNVKIQDIADCCGVKYSTIRKWLKIHNLVKLKGGRSKIPWNKGKTYNLGFRNISESHLAIIRNARSGPNSNFWKGGICNDRLSIGRWTTQIANKIHSKNNGRCQLCNEKSSVLHCHHIIPVWYDPSKAKDENNLTTVCQKCHVNHINRRELDYVDYFREKNNLTPLKLNKKKIINKIKHIKKAKLVKIKEFVFVGMRKTYDVSVKGPFHNFIANGIVTHNSVNEYSTRYSLAIDSAQKTDPLEWRIQSKTNNQGSSDDLLSVEIGEELSMLEDMAHNSCRMLYEKSLESGVAREQARKNLPLCTYTELYWKGDLHNLFHFLSLRMDSHAQYEVRCYANTIGEIVRQLYPICYEAFEDYRLNGLFLTGIDIKVLNQVLDAVECRVSNAKDILTLDVPDEWQKEKCRERDECFSKLRKLGVLAK